jgi:hypothetical protein
VTDVVVVGGGPAGWSLASACARQGLRVTLISATRGWPATYGLWLDETEWLPTRSRWVTTRVRGGGRWLPREYVVLDNESVLAAFAHPGIDVVKARATAMTATEVRLTDGDVLRASMVFDATGVLGATNRIEQTAYGVMAPAEAAPGEAVFMDWRQPPGFGEPATFLYAVPLPDGRVLLEETCLARRPGLGFAELRDRLHARLGWDPQLAEAPAEEAQLRESGGRLDAGSGPVEEVRLRESGGRLDAGSGPVEEVRLRESGGRLDAGSGSVQQGRFRDPRDRTLAGSGSVEEERFRGPRGGPIAGSASVEQARFREPGGWLNARSASVERVRFPVDVGPPALRAGGAIPFGAAAGLVHPATGFSLAETFRLAPLVASSVRGGPRAVRRVLWPVSARVVYRLRRRGLATLLSLTAAEHEEFFDVFFALPDHHQRAYLSGRDLRGTAAAMAAVFLAAPNHLRRKMIKP